MLAASSLVKWIPISHPYLQNKWNLSHLLLANRNWLHLIVITFNTLCPVEFYIQWCQALHWTRWCSYLKKNNLSLPWKLIFSKSYRSWQPKLISQSWGIPEHILSHHYKTHIKHILKNIAYLTKKTPKLVTKILAANFSSEPECLSRL